MNMEQQPRLSDFSLQVKKYGKSLYALSPNIMKKHQIYIKTCKVVKSFECQNYFGVYSILQTYISYEMSF